MPHSSLIQYVSRRLASGRPVDAVRAECEQAGWSAIDVEEAIHLATVTPPVSTAITSFGIKSLFHREYYQQILLGKRTFPLFFAILAISLCFSIAPSITVSTKIFPIITSAQSNISTVIDEVLPEKAQITLKSGLVETNLVEPYFVSVKKSTLDTVYPGFIPQTGNAKIRLLAIDTKAKAENFEQYQTYALLTQSSLVYYNDGKVTIRSLREVSDMTITREEVKKRLADFLDRMHLKTILNVLFLANPLIILLCLLFLIWMYILLMALTVWLLVAIHGVPAKYKAVVGYTGALSLLPFALQLFGGKTFTFTGLSLSFVLSDSITAALWLWLAYITLPTEKKSQERIGGTP